MSEEQINIAMAKACGWREEPEPIGRFNATARQRAEAFLRTLGKWEEQ